MIHPKFIFFKHPEHISNLTSMITKIQCHVNWDQFTPHFFHKKKEFLFTCDFISPSYLMIFLPQWHYCTCSLGTNEAQWLCCQAAGPKESERGSAVPRCHRYLNPPPHFPKQNAQPTCTRAGRCERANAWDPCRLCLMMWQRVYEANKGDSNMKDNTGGSSLSYYRMNDKSSCTLSQKPQKEA